MRCGTSRRSSAHACISVNQLNNKNTEMAAVKYYPEDVLVEKFQSGEYGWLDYVNHHSAEWQEEYTEFCKERNLTVNEESAEQFVEWKGEQMEAGE